MKAIPLTVVLSVCSLSPVYAQQREVMTLSFSDNQVMAAGKWLKAAAGTVEIPFGMTFAAPPIVVIFPNWTGEVGGRETIIKVQVSSGNAAGNYHVSWIAVGRK